MRFRYSGDHAEVLGNSKPLAPGQIVDLRAADQKHPQTARLIREGKLERLDPPKTTNKQTDDSAGKENHARA